MLTSAVRLAVTALGEIPAHNYEAPTPCDEYSVRTLANHMIAILRRVDVVVRGAGPMSVPNIADDVADGTWSEAAATAASGLDADLADPAILGRPVRMPFGELPAAAAVAIYANEITLHTWDLAKATGSTPSWDPAVLAAGIAGMSRVPATPRGGPIPFGPVVDVPDDAADIDRLVAWYGRTP